MKVVSQCNWGWKSIARLQIRCYRKNYGIFEPRTHSNVNVSSMFHGIHMRVTTSVAPPPCLAEKKKHPSIAPNSNQLSYIRHSPLPLRRLCNRLWANILLQLQRHKEVLLRFLLTVNTIARTNPDMYPPIVMPPASPYAHLKTSSSGSSLVSCPRGRHSTCTQSVRPASTPPMQTPTQYDIDPIPVSVLSYMEGCVFGGYLPCSPRDRETVYRLCSSTLTTDPLDAS